MQKRGTRGRTSTRDGRGPLAALLAAAAFVAALFAIAAPVASAAGATYFVAPSGSGTDCGANSQADPFATIQDALACAADGDAISLAPSGASPYPGVGAITEDVTIEAEPGANARTVRVDVSPAPEPLSVPSGASVTVEGVTLACEDGIAPSIDPCGPNVTNNGALTLRRVAVIGALSAPGIANLSPDGGAANLTVLDSTIADNQNFSASSFGGAIGSADAPGTTTAQDPSVTVGNSTIADNLASRGGGLDVADGTATLVNSTITGNEATSGSFGGGGIGTDSGATVELSNTLVAGNTASDGPDCLSGLPTTGDVIDGPGGHNLIGDGEDCETLASGVNGDRVWVDPGLNPLADNGGPTDTAALQASSPAIGAADPTTCDDPPISGLDQRGEPRDPTAGCDIGALDTGGDGGVVNATYFVAPSGSGTDCGANSQANPFATIQDALACVADGDAVSLAPSGGTPYPGIGAISENVTIEAEPGANARTVQVDVSPAPGPLSVSAGAAAMVEGVTLVCVDGLVNQPIASPCGPNATNSGALTLRRVAVTNAISAPGIANLSPDGGAAHLTVLESTISDNAHLGGVDAFGGGIESARAPGTTTAQDPSVTVANSTIADNGDGARRGGGLDVANGTASVVNSTITGNEASASGGGGGIGTAPTASVELSNTVVAGNTSSNGPDCLSGGATVGDVIDGPGGHNVIGDGSGCVTLTDGVNGDQVGVPDPGLGSLADNGGSTDTVALLAASAAIATADLTTCQDPPVSGLDQRGTSRNANARGSCDIGAYDTGGPVSVTTASLPGGRAGSAYSRSLSGAGGVGPYAWSVSAGSLPAGLALNASNGAVTGSPTAAGISPFTVEVTDRGGQTATRPLSITVAKATTALSGTASAPIELGGHVHDRASLTGGSSPGGKVAFALYGPGDPACSSPPAFTDTVAVSGNGGYRSADFAPPAAGTYRWMASYSGDASNAAAATGCGGATQAVTVKSPRRTLTVSRTGDGQGTVMSTPAGIDCGGTCSHSYDEGTEVTLTASAAADSTFSGWSGAGCSGTGPCTVVLRSDRNLTASFESRATPRPPGTELEKRKVRSKRGRGRAKFTFEATGDSTGFECALASKRQSRPRFKPCRSPRTYKRLKAGRYTFRVRAVGPGGPDPSPVKTRFKIR